MNIYANGYSRLLNSLLLTEKEKKYSKQNIFPKMNVRKMKKLSKKKDNKMKGHRI